MRPTYALLTLALFAATPPPSALAQAPSRPAADAWAAWQGCWRADEDVAGTGSRTCIVPTQDGGTRWITLVGAQRLREEGRIADGTVRPVADGACRGTESSRWSAERQRLYHEATVTCGAETARRLASVAYLVPGPRLIEVQTVTEGASTNVRVQRLRPATNHALPDGTEVPRAAAGAAMRPHQPWTVADVIEASAHLPADGVQAALMEGPTAFSLTKATLIAMADAHVAEPVIDLMVAATYPKHFVVQSAGASGSFGIASMGAGSGWVDPFYAPIIGPASLYDCYSPYSWASTAYWRQCDPYDSRYIVGYPGYYRGYYGDSAYFNGPWYVSTPNGTPSPAPRGEGRVVNGRGYTQVTPIDTSVSAMGDGGRASGQSVGGTSTGSTSGATSSGYSGGGSSGGGGSERTAVPRPPGR